MLPLPEHPKFGKEEIDDMSDPEPSRIKHEDTEEQISWCIHDKYMTSFSFCNQIRLTLTDFILILKLFISDWMEVKQQRVKVNEVEEKREINT